jgi:cholesterol oxidase
MARRFQLIFSIDTIDTSLLEYLYAGGCDVWLLDYRASIELPHASNSPPTTSGLRLSGGDAEILELSEAVVAGRGALLRGDDLFHGRIRGLTGVR